MMFYSSRFLLFAGNRILISYRSVVKIQTDEAGKRIVQVEDRWDDKLPEGPFATVSFAYCVLLAVNVPLPVLFHFCR